MNKEYTINYFPHSRFYYASSFINEIIKIKESLRTKLKINLLFSHYEPNLESIISFLQTHNIESQYHIVEGGDYMTKIETALNNTTTEFFLKLDEDVFLPASVWEFLLESSNELNDNENAFISPLLSTGIPTVDFFIKQFFDDNAKKEIFDIFLKVQFGVIWDVDYNSLNEYTVNAKEWNPDNFYDGVSKINHYYKGIHPVRLSSEAQDYITNYVINNFNRLLEKRDYSILKTKKPYLCNNIVTLKTNTFSKIVADKSLFKDGFDEVPINLYMENNELNMLLINNGLGVHPSYNTIGNYYKTISDRFFSSKYFLENHK